MEQVGDNNGIQDLPISRELWNDEDDYHQFKEPEKFGPSFNLYLHNASQEGGRRK